jgi:hypothetical protein
MTIKIDTSNFQTSAVTLDEDYLGTHENGWTIEGKVCYDYAYWVNAFKATHVNGDVVYGDFEEEVFATSQAVYDQFIAEFPPAEWDYLEI